MAQKAKFSVGQVVKVTKADGGHNVPIGTVGPIVEIYHDNTYFKLAGWLAGWIPTLSLEVVGSKQSLETAKEMALKDLEAAKQRLQVAEDKLAFMEEAGSELFDENEYKAYVTLKVLETDTQLSRLERAKKIAALFKS